MRLFDLNEITVEIETSPYCVVSDGYFYTVKVSQRERLTEGVYFTLLYQDEVTMTRCVVSVSLTLFQCSRERKKVEHLLTVMKSLEVHHHKMHFRRLSVCR